MSHAHDSFAHHCSRDIAACIDGLRAQIANASHAWTDCVSDNTIFPQQATLLHIWLGPLHDRHGFAAAQLCGLYVADGMRGEHEPKRRCSFALDCERGATASCSASADDKNSYGLPPCVCSALEHQFGPAPMRSDSGMDLHPWGMFLADRILDRARTLRRPPWWTEVSEQLLLIRQHMVGRIDEEPLHGFLWRLLAADRGLSGITHVATFAHQACSLFYESVCRHTCLECAHGIGHGVYYRLNTIDRAVEYCVSLAHSISNSSSVGRSHVLRDINWQMACAGGAFHSWFNSMTWLDQQPALQAKDMGTLCDEGRMASRGEARAAWSRVCREALGFEGAQDRLALAQMGKCGRHAPSAAVLDVAMSRIHNGSSVDITASGIELLSTLPSAQVYPHVARLVALMEHSQEDLRAASLRAVAKHGGAEHRSALHHRIQTGLRDPAWVVREAAAEVTGLLTPTDVQQHLDALQALLTDDEHHVRTSARAALSRAGVSHYPPT